MPQTCLNLSTMLSRTVSHCWWLEMWCNGTGNIWQLPVAPLNADASQTRGNTWLYLSHISVNRKHLIKTFTRTNVTVYFVLVTLWKWYVFVKLTKKADSWTYAIVDDLCWWKNCNWFPETSEGNNKFRNREEQNPKNWKTQRPHVQVNWNHYIFSHCFPFCWCDFLTHSSTALGSNS